MLKKAVDRIVPNYSELKNRTVFLSLLAYSFLLRFPFVFRDYIDRDESTFIIVAQNWVDGYLPYTVLWDLKPPVTFLFFSVIIAAFGKSLIAIRIAGIIMVAIIGLFTYRIAAEISSKKIGFWSALFTVILISSFGSLQGVMSEHISMLFFMPAVYLIMTYRTLLGWTLAGLLLGAAVMTKMNLAYPVLFLGLFLIYDVFRKSNRPIRPLKLLGFGFGVVLVIGLTILPYFLNGQTSLWWNAVVLAPLEYAEVRRGSLVASIPLIIFLSILIIYNFRTGIISIRDKRTQVLLIAILGVLVALIRGGVINGHYLIQLHPLWLVPIAILFAHTTGHIKWDYKPYALLLIFLLPIEAYKEYYDVARHKAERGTFINGEGFYVPQYIINQKLPTENLLFLEYHIGYWILDILPPTKAATHPTNLVRDETFTFYDNPRKTSMEELRYIFEELRPEIVITRTRWHVFDKEREEENSYVRAYLEANYEIRELIDNAEVHQRLER